MRVNCEDLFMNAGGVVSEWLGMEAQIERKRIERGKREQGTTPLSCNSTRYQVLYYTERITVLCTYIQHS